MRHCAGRGWLIETAVLFAVDQDAVFQVGAHGPCQDYPFQVASFADEVLDRIAMADSDGILRDDRATIEVRGDVMAGGSNQLDPRR